MILWKNELFSAWHMMILLWNQLFLLWNHLILSKNQMILQRNALLCMDYEGLGYSPRVGLALPISLGINCKKVLNNNG
jgi:hypothetical protein